jgi:DNA-directed RNA polymerase subunit H (RpoH/RPB5)
LILSTPIEQGRMSYEIADQIDTLYRSRITLLDHLETSGYDTTPYRKFSHKELELMIQSGPVAGAPPALTMTLKKKEATDPIQTCMVVTTLGKIKQKLKSFTQSYIDPTDTGFDVNTTELIVITLEPIVHTFHTEAFENWNKYKARVRYFQAAAIINNPLRHVLVPLHERITKEEEDTLLKELYAKKVQFPLIRFHEDPIARMLGLLPGEIVKITRPSLTAGIYTTYRICAP